MKLVNKIVVKKPLRVIGNTTTISNIKQEFSTQNYLDKLKQDSESPHAESSLSDVQDFHGYGVAERFSLKDDIVKFNPEHIGYSIQGKNLKWFCTVTKNKHGGKILTKNRLMKDI